MEKVILKTEMPDVGAPRRGKVRDIYDLGDYLLLVVTDRVSAFDVVLPGGIPGKGKVLTAISVFWFRMMEDIVGNHIIATDVKDFPQALHKYRETLEGRSLLVKKAKVVPVECIVRGYLSGSGWKSYREDGAVCGIKLPAGLLESSKIEQPVFTPSTKAEAGHDINIPFDEMKKIVGDNTALKLKDLTLKIYERARDYAQKKGIIIADTKMEFGILNDQVIIIDELLTPDSSRFWSVKKYAPGKSQDSFDKQIVRDYLLTLDWDQTPPGPELPPDIVKKTSERYQEILRILTGTK
ncbi:MAG: phosphoribosylaminoimidazolesuccinocarboxamide synthase [Nitrospiraceae bacterium]|nr:MAG: phosphoribosylaminoimidazolesuccinocarboxamide synthase [Nitrospiraceae bacterium]